MSMFSRHGSVWSAGTEKERNQFIYLFLGTDWREEITIKYRRVEAAHNGPSTGSPGLLRPDKTITYRPEPVADTRVHRE